MTILVPEFTLRGIPSIIQGMKISFRERVLSIVRGIPRGSVLSYKEVAQIAGHPGASRAVGSLMKRNVDPEIPCHRVVRSDGRIGEYNRGGAQKKSALLAGEGVLIRNGKIMR